MNIVQGISRLQWTESKRFTWKARCLIVLAAVPALGALTVAGAALFAPLIVLAAFPVAALLSRQDRLSVSLWLIFNCEVVKVLLPMTVFVNERMSECDESGK